MRVARKGRQGQKQFIFDQRHEVDFSTVEVDIFERRDFRWGRICWPQKSPVHRRCERDFHRLQTPLTARLYPRLEKPAGKRAPLGITLEPQIHRNGGLQTGQSITQGGFDQPNDACAPAGQQNRFDVTRDGLSHRKGAEYTRRRRTYATSGRLPER